MTGVDYTQVVVMVGIGVAVIIGINIVGQEYQFSSNNGSITISGNYSPNNQHNIGGVFFYNMD